MSLLLKSIFGFWLWWGSPETPATLPGHETDVQKSSPVICIREGEGFARIIERPGE